MVKQFLASPKLPLRFYLAAGTFEVDRDGGGGGILESTRNLRDVLLARGYQVHYQQFVGGHDGLVGVGRSLTASLRCSEFTKAPRTLSVLIGRLGPLGNRRRLLAFTRGISLEIFDQKKIDFVRIHDRF